jgi:hypothetical protein
MASLNLSRALQECDNYLFSLKIFNFRFELIYMAFFKCCNVKYNTLGREIH